MLNSKEISAVQKVKKIVSDNIIMMCLILVIIVIICINPGFFQIAVLKDILMQNSTKLILASGMAMILISGGMDLSAGRMLGIGAVVAASLGQTFDYAKKFYPNLQELPVIVPLLVAIIICALFGLFNGFAVAKLRIPAFIVTLGTQTIIWGANLLYFDKAPNNSNPIGGIQDKMKFWGSGLIGGKIPIIIIIAIAVVIVIGFLMKKITFGRNIYAIGGNSEAAVVSGINVKKTLMITYCIAGALFGLAGFLECARTGSATAAYGAGYEMDGIAACVVGGISLSGGIGDIFGAFIGIFMFGVIKYGLTFIGINSYWQQVITGIIVIAAVGVDIRKSIQK